MMNSADPVEQQHRSAVPVSPRRRRLRRTLWILGALAVLGTATGICLFLASRPKQYRPDEKSDDLTSSLAARLPSNAPKPRFTNVTTQAGLAQFRTFNGVRTSQLPEDMGAGVAWGDFNNDGKEDLFLVSAGGALGMPTESLAESVLYENIGNGQFRRVPGFPELRFRGMAAAWADYDGDGFLDLAVSGYNALYLYHNEGGTGRFIHEQSFPNRDGFWSGVSWGDFNNDRFPDLYVCGYVQYVENEADRTRPSQQAGVPYTLNPSSYVPAENLLFKNLGGRQFTEVAKQFGVTNPEGRSLSALWNDFDDDGWLDLYVANDVSDNVFYHNEHGTLRDISHAAWVADHRSAMGLAAGDFDRDGDDDLYITHWVAQENALYENFWSNFSSAKTNGPSTSTNLLRFTDIADMKGLGQIALPFVGWGTEFADFDGDGWLDIAVANGNTLEIDGSSPNQLQPQEAFLFWNDHGQTFHDLAPLNSSLSEKHVSRGLALADYDNDGTLDILISDLGEGVRLLKNQMQSGSWAKFTLKSLNAKGVANGFGDGARVIAHLNGTALRRSVTSASYLSQSSRVVHFGLGPATKIDLLEVRWLAGATNYFTNVTANAWWQITEGATALTRLDSQGTVAPAQAQDRARVLEFWNAQRAAMDALKVEANIPQAAELFRTALKLQPEHEDSHYYLAHCLAAQNDIDGALATLRELTRINPQSHRAFQQWGTLRASTAINPKQLSEAEEALLRAHQINPEETGALRTLGEISILQGDWKKAEARFAAVCRTNPKAGNAYFLHSYARWRNGDVFQSTELLHKTREALGPEWKPSGTTAEGDVRKKQFLEKTPLASFFQEWNGSTDPQLAFQSLDKFLQKN